MLVGNLRLSVYVQSLLFFLGSLLVVVGGKHSGSPEKYRTY